MKTVIVALNSKYIHSSLAPWYLKYACGDSCGEIKVLEYTINDNIEWMLAKTYMEKPDVIAFSCYIWNITQVLKLASDLKKVLPYTPIIFGGPEVSFGPEEVMLNNPFVDYIISGEGEISFSQLLRNLRHYNTINSCHNTINDYCNTIISYCNTINAINNKIESIENIESKENYSINHIGDISAIDSNSNFEGIDDIEGLCYRNKREIIYDGKYCLIENLDLLPSPYTDEMLDTLENRIVYYEASRGCPFFCSYCLSSTFNGVRHFSLERIKRDILRLINAEVRQVKFVDRTFNCNKKRAKEIIKFIIDSSTDTDTNFHFEAAGDLFDEEMLELLAEAKEGLIQFEIGVQSVNEETLNEIGRKTDIEKVFRNVSRLKSYGNIHLHLDLIAGLPYEDYTSIQKSFNKVYGLKPHKLQLGFLKILKGSRIRSQIEKHGYLFRDYPPYEVLNNKYMSFDEMTEFKGIEEIFERYYNSGRFINSLNFVIRKFFDDPFQFYREFYLFNLEEGYLDKALPARELYTIFYNFIKSIVSVKASIKATINTSTNTSINTPKNVSTNASENIPVNAPVNTSANVPVNTPVNASANAPAINIGLLHELGIVNDLLKFDYLSTNSSGQLPDGIAQITESGYKEKRLDFLRDERNRVRYFPDFVGMAPKHLLKYVNFEIFEYDITELIRDSGSIDTEICDSNTGSSTNTNNYGNSKTYIVKKRTTILFNYNRKHGVTGVYEYHKIEF